MWLHISQNRFLTGFGSQIHSLKKTDRFGVRWCSALFDFLSSTPAPLVCKPWWGKKLIWIVNRARCVMCCYSFTLAKLQTSYRYPLSRCHGRFFFFFFSHVVCCASSRHILMPRLPAAFRAHSRNLTWDLINCPACMLSGWLHGRSQLWLSIGRGSGTAPHLRASQWRSALGPFAADCRC